MFFVKKLPLFIIRGLKNYSLKKIDKLKSRVAELNSVLSGRDVIKAVQSDLESLESFKTSFKDYKTQNLTSDYEQYKELAYYHFMLRHILAYYEARVDVAPVQIYNEYRMAFDHYMRRVEMNNEGHEKKALAHLLRANLDIIKLGCYWLKEYCEKKHRWMPKKALGIISNGEYIKTYTKLQVCAEGLFREAKEKEVLIDESDNMDILDKFLVAFLKYKEWNEYQENNLENVMFINMKYYLIVGFPLMFTAVMGAIIGFILSRLLENSGIVIDVFNKIAH
jgi:hypothetical protein